MIAMQYSFTLPADYDMAIVRERIASKGPLLDDLPGLVFKAYLYADQGGAEANRYAPFYLWHDAEAMHGFLNGSAFAGVARAFGWPSVHTWTLWHASVDEQVRQARHASRDSLRIAPHSALPALRQAQEDYARQARADGALAVLIGFEPVNWTIVRLCLWRAAPQDAASEARQHYRVGHVSAPGAPGSSAALGATAADGRNEGV